MSAIAAGTRSAKTREARLRPKAARAVPKAIALILLRLDIWQSCRSRKILRESGWVRRRRWGVSEDPRAAFMRLYMRCAALPEVGRIYGLTAEEMGLALHYARVSKIVSTGANKSFSIPPPVLTSPPGKTWCAQCDRLVVTAEAEGCSSQWCKAKETKAA